MPRWNPFPLAPPLASPPFFAEFEVAAKTSFELDGFAFLHDFAITKNFFVVFQNPVTGRSWLLRPLLGSCFAKCRNAHPAVDNVPYVLGKAPAAACVRWVAGKPTLLHLIPRPGRTDAQVGRAALSRAGSMHMLAAGFAYPLSVSTSRLTCTCWALCKPGVQGLPLQPRTFTAPSLFVFHHANAYESEDGQRIVVDSIHYESLPAVGREALAEQQVGRGHSLLRPCSPCCALAGASCSSPRSSTGRSQPPDPTLRPIAGAMLPRRSTPMWPSAAGCAAWRLTCAPACCKSASSLTSTWRCVPSTRPARCGSRALDEVALVSAAGGVHSEVPAW